MITFHLEKLRKGLEFHISNYEKIFSVGYFNSKMSQTSVNSFWNLCNFKFLVQDPTYFFLSKYAIYFLKTNFRN